MVCLVLLIQPGLVAVQRVGVLHPELAHPDQPATRAQLVAELGLYLVHQGGKLPVGGDLRRRVVRYRLFVGHRQHQVAPAAVAEPRQGGVDFPCQRPVARHRSAGCTTGSDSS